MFSTSYHIPDNSDAMSVYDSDSESTGLTAMNIAGATHGDSSSAPATKRTRLAVRFVYFLVLSVVLMGLVAFGYSNGPSLVAYFMAFNVTGTAGRPSVGPLGGGGGGSGGDESSVFAFTLNRENYPPLQSFTAERHAFLNYKMLTPYAAVIEPYVPMQLYLKSDYDLGEYDYDFTICDADTGEDCQTATLSHAASESIVVECTPLSTYEVEVVEYYANTAKKTGKSLTSQAICMYVRREIQDLTKDDLDAMLDALLTLWQYTDEEGQAKYGEDFHNNIYLTEAHHFNTAWQDADHLHEGLGFMAQHIKLTNIAEKAMQAVNPAVTLPYWEFTKEVVQNKTIFESFMFTNETFGSIPQPDDLKWGFRYKTNSVLDGAIPNGRWAYLQSEVSRFDVVKSAFGYIRAPWSLNPSPYVSRFGSAAPGLTSCTNYYHAVAAKNIAKFLESMEKDVHAPIHQALGNVFGCDVFDDLRANGYIKDTDSAQIGICKAWNYYIKDLYRSNYITPQTDCVTLDECGFICTESKLSKLPQYLQFKIESQFLPSSLPSDAYDVFTDFVCNGNGSKVLLGTHAESSSSSDPSFWPLHPAQERLFHAKLLANNIKTWTWPSNSKKDYVCDSAMCFDIESDSFGYFDTCCYGNYEYDRMFDFGTGVRTAFIGPTNHEVLRDSNPVLSTYNMTYVYDHFEYDHCGDELEELFEEQYNTAH